MMVTDGCLVVEMLRESYAESHKGRKPFFTNFFIFLNGLIHSKLDIQILRREGIVQHFLRSDEEAADLTNALAKRIDYSPGEGYSMKETEEVNRRCKDYFESKWVIWRKNLVGAYFSSPWSFISLLAATSLLILTFLQTFYTMYTYYE
ncbi:hypothetical protein CRG98_019564 [Punica granatum]|uniref:Uncharacterized protein n=1 Tax=Punica granatum TaxID=22663 RepID=A0A2I0JUT0_PUNGR|nr:hypothetical protein CRG98_019564 [Punica granatum]